MITEDTVCFKHENRPAAVGCQRCDKPICSSCMNSASVGFHCPNCTKSGAQTVHRGIPGGPMSGPVLTKIILAIIGVVFLVQNGLDITSDLVLFGPSVADGEVWRIITSAVAHNDLLHIGFNGYALWILGGILEPAFGRFRYLLIYLGGMFGGSLAVLAFDWSAPTLGASGAVLGVVAGLAVAYQARGLSVFRSSLGAMIALNLGLPLIFGGISFWGHLGGFIGGGIIALLLKTGQPRSNQFNSATLSAVIVVVALAVGSVLVGYAGPII